MHLPLVWTFVAFLSCRIMHAFSDEIRKLKVTPTVSIPMTLCAMLNSLWCLQANCEKLCQPACYQAAQNVSVTSLPAGLEARNRWESFITSTGTGLLQRVSLLAVVLIQFPPFSVSLLSPPSLTPPSSLPSPSLLLPSPSLLPHSSSISLSPCMCPCCQASYHEDIEEHITERLETALKAVMEKVTVFPIVSDCEMHNIMVALKVPYWL